MDQKKIDRINELARKAKSPEGLTEEELLERQVLREEYILSIRKNLEAQLDNTVLVDEQGNRKKLKKKHKKKGH